MTGDVCGDARRTSHRPQIIPQPREVHDHIADLTIAPRDGDLVGIDQHQLALDRVAPVIIRADAHKTAERRILGKRF